VTEGVTANIVRVARPRDDAAPEISESSPTEVEIAGREHLGREG
jgi:hypothetical protein